MAASRVSLPIAPPEIANARVTRGRLHRRPPSTDVLEVHHQQCRLVLDSADDVSRAAFTLLVESHCNQTSTALVEGLLCLSRRIADHHSAGGAVKLKSAADVLKEPQVSDERVGDAWRTVVQLLISAQDLQATSQKTLERLLRVCCRSAEHRSLQRAQGQLIARPDYKPETALIRFFEEHFRRTAVLAANMRTLEEHVRLQRCDRTVGSGRMHPARPLPTGVSRMPGPDPPRKHRPLLNRGDAVLGKTFAAEVASSSVTSAERPPAMHCELKSRAESLVSSKTSSGSEVFREEEDAKQGNTKNSLRKPWWRGASTDEDEALSASASALRILRRPWWRGPSADNEDLGTKGQGIAAPNGVAGDSCPAKATTDAPHSRMDAQDEEGGTVPGANNQKGLQGPPKDSPKGKRKVDVGCKIGLCVVS
mmetsp:Transcript_29393/g.85676  ORF Transcript_29393/g.85676 Transcript_29393/m.85676 type:complete len:422 (-) Transcript_29393:119-1384(-)